MTTKQPRYYLPARYYLPVTLEQLQNLQSLLDVRAREPNPGAEVFQLLEGVRKTRVDAVASREKVQKDATALEAEETNVRGRIKRAAKYVNELLSYGGIFPGQGPFGSTLEYRYHDGDLEDEISRYRPSPATRWAEAVEAGAIFAPAKLIGNPMLIHLIPQIVAERTNVPCSLVDVTCRELGLNLIGGKELTARRPYPNKNYLVACRKVGQKAVNGFLVETQDLVREFTVVTRWAVDASHIATHSVRYILADDEFDTVTEEMMLWGATHPSQGDYKSRYPVGCTYGSPLESQPKMEAYKRIKRVGELTDQLDKHGAVIERSEVFRLPTVERDRLSRSVFGDRMPAIENAFR